MKHPNDKIKERMGTEKIANRNKKRTKKPIRLISQYVYLARELNKSFIYSTEVKKS